MVERAMMEQVQPTPHAGTSADEERRPAPIRLVIVDDHALLREGTIQLLKQSADFDVVGQAGSGEDGLAIVERLQPDVALIDVHLPKMSGLELARAAASSSPGVRVLILSAYDDYAYVTEALEIGVGGYLLKTASAKELADAVRAVADGILVLDRGVADRLDPAGAKRISARQRVDAAGGRHSPPVGPRPVEQADRHRTPARLAHRRGSRLERAREAGRCV